jgi:hypothetical protein
MKKLIFILSTILMYSCGTTSSFQKSQNHSLSDIPLRMRTYTQVFNDMYEISKSDSICINDINFILKKDGRIIQFLNDTLTFNFIDTSINCKLSNPFIYDWEDNLSFENSFILVKLVSDEGQCFIGNYKFINQQDVNAKNLFSNCKDSKLFSDSSIWNMNKTNNFRLQYPPQYRRKNK